MAGALVPRSAARSARAALADPETLRAAGLAAATMANNLLGVVITLIFTRLLGTDGYGSLAALMNLSLILFVPGSALQVAATRMTALGRLGEGAELSSTVRAWIRRVPLAIAAVAVVSALLREPLGALVNVEEAWAAAAVPVTAVLWLVLCVLRGVLLARRAYRIVGASLVIEAAGRLAGGVVLAEAGLGVTGAYLGTATAFALAAALVGAVLLHRLGPAVAGPRPRRIATLMSGAALPIAALGLVACLQNLDVIVARHVLAEEAAGVYAAATVAAKAVVWIAVGIGLWLLPEAVHRATEGREPRGVLLRAFALTALIVVPACVAYAAVPALVLRTAFGPDYATAAGYLLVLGIAYGLLALTYLSVQFLLGLHRLAFLAVLAAAAAAEGVLLATVDTPEGIATVVLAVQAGAAAAIVWLALRERARDPLRPAAPPPAAAPAG